MAFQIPEILSQACENYIVSIRLLPDGLSFSGYNARIKGSFFLTEAKWDAADSYVESFKEFFFGQPCLGWAYKQLYVVQKASPYTLVPYAFWEEKEEASLYAFNCGKAQGKVLASEWPDAQMVLLYEMEQELYDFCARSLQNPCFMHSQQAVLALWKRKSQEQLARTLFVSASAHRMDVGCYEQGRLLFANAYSVSSLSDMLYYLLYICKCLPLVAEHDSIALAGDVSVVEALKKSLQTYVRQVDSLAMPSEVYLMGTDMLRAPVDLIALSLYANH